LTVRLSEAVIQKLRDESNASGAAMNDVAKQILTGHVRWGPYAASVPFIVVPVDVLTGALNELPDKTIIVLARKAGKELARRLELFREGFKHDDLLGLIGSWLESSGMVVEYTIGKESNCVVLHKMSRQWSLYLANLLEAGLKEVKPRWRLTFDVKDDGVRFSIKAPHQF
jgi:hypothetical protein